MTEHRRDYRPLLIQTDPNLELFMKLIEELAQLRKEIDMFKNPENYDADGGYVRRCKFCGSNQLTISGSRTHYFENERGMVFSLILPDTTCNACGKTYPELHEDSNIYLGTWNEQKRRYERPD